MALTKINANLNRKTIHPDSIKTAQATKTNISVIATFLTTDRKTAVENFRVTLA